jgi:hypothetical protein
MKSAALALFLLAGTAQQPPPTPAPRNAVSPKPQQKPKSAEAQPANVQRGTEQAPFVVKMAAPEQAGKESNANTEKRDKEAEHWGLSDRIATLIAAVGFLQFLALISTVWVMILNGRRQLRAYVLPESGGLWEGTTLNPPDPARAGIPGVALWIKNGGQTPAYRVVSWVGIQVIPVRDEHTALVIPPLREQYANTLGAGSGFSKTWWLDRPLAANEIQDIATGTRAIYVYGRIEYRDAFKRKRFTEFRLHYTGIFPPAAGSILNFSERGNRAN